MTRRELLRPTFQVKKIYENEKRLQAGDHSLDLLAHDFEKNYNMYIFPVHWQFGQLDQHPVDGYVGVMGRGRWCCVSPTKGQTYPCCPVCLLPDISPTQSSPLCARLSFPWSIAPPASLSSAMLTLTNTSPWRSGPPALASRTVSTEHLTNLIRSLGLWDRVFGWVGRDPTSSLFWPCPLCVSRLCVCRGCGQRSHHLSRSDPQQQYDVSYSLLTGKGADP